MQVTILLMGTDVNTNIARNCDNFRLASELVESIAKT